MYHLSSSWVLLVVIISGGALCCPLAPSSAIGKVLLLPLSSPSPNPNGLLRGRLLLPLHLLVLSQHQEEQKWTVDWFLVNWFSPPKSAFMCFSFFFLTPTRRGAKVVVVNCSRLWLTGTEEQVISNFSHSQQCGWILLGNHHKLSFLMTRPFTGAPQHAPLPLHSSGWVTATTLSD